MLCDVEDIPCHTFSNEFFTTSWTLHNESHGISIKSIAETNAAARVVCLVPKFDHITPTLMRLHWLKIKNKIHIFSQPCNILYIFKIVLLVYKVLHGLAPKYICDMLTYKQSNNYSLRSDELGLLHVPSTRRKSFGDRAFLKAGPTLWKLSTV